MYGCYIRVSSKDQKHDSQRAEIIEWLERNGIRDDKVVWFEDVETARTLNRKALKELETAIFNGRVQTVVVWKLDRLSRRMLDGVNILARWCEHGTRVVSITQQIDLSGSLRGMIAKYGIDHEKQAKQLLEVQIAHNELPQEQAKLKTWVDRLEAVEEEAKRVRLEEQKRFTTPYVPVKRTLVVWCIYWLCSKKYRRVIKIDDAMMMAARSAEQLKYDRAYQAYIKRVHEENEIKKAEWERDSFKNNGVLA